MPTHLYGRDSRTKNEKRLLMEIELRQQIERGVIIMLSNHIIRNLVDCSTSQKVETRDF
jgi:hypothetical protein